MKAKVSQKTSNGIDVYFNVFNITDDEMKKVKALFKKYGIDYSSIAKANKKGIMSIFNEEPTLETFLFTVLVSMIKNGDINYKKEETK